MSIDPTGHDLRHQLARAEEVIVALMCALDALTWSYPAYTGDSPTKTIREAETAMTKWSRYHLRYHLQAERSA
jgi:hypothetical protein